ncbi:hypothetical protein [Piscinibacter gummiphilus]|nr:hypothetical protein [Piscinibacter gummiphilus]GLS95520.1 hypothetical protein GCM10007918_28120 [Piscinibacter gummiphilus]
MTLELHLSHDRNAGTVTTHEHIGFELGWDYAHYNVHLPAPYAQEPSPLRNGLLAGAATFGMRTLQPTRHVRKWLQLRLHAWLRGRSVELVQVTPHYLQQIDVTHCPITRVALSSATLESTDASIDRVRSDAGYAAGNLAVMSAKANHAKGAHGFRDALGFVRQIEAESLGGIAGLTAAQWARTAVLCSYVERLSHAEACALPMLVLPPNRLRLFNPVQALQAFVSLQLATEGWSHRLSRFEDLLPGKDTKRAFQMFFHALLPRVLEAGRSAEPHEVRWAIEDAWRNPLALQRWTAFASQLTEAQCEDLVARASQRKLGTTRLDRVNDDQAVEGWNLDSRGYVPHTVLMRRRVSRARPVDVRPPARVPQQAHLPLQ